MGRTRRVIPSEGADWSAVYDVVVVGAGAAGLPAALNAARNGSQAVVLEKAAEAGGTMKKSAAWYWIPNNSYMQRDGLADDRDGFVRYVARLARPQAYDPDDPHLGLGEWEYETICALYDNAAVANDTLAELGAIRPL